MTMLRFTIRDLLWLMVVVGMLISWPIDHWRLSKAHRFASKDRDLWKTRATALKATVGPAGDIEPAYDVEWINYGKAGFKIRPIKQPAMSEKERAKVPTE